MSADPAVAKRRVFAFATAVIALAVSVGTIEIVFRLVGYDFDHKVRAFEDTPIFYRRPILPLGDGLFRRPGPARWAGRVITPMLERLGVPAELIPPESPIVAQYDANGFRNDPDLDDWEIAVAGDSFTELGQLPQQELFTSELARELSLRVANLGVSYTGPRSHVDFLRRFGGAPSLRYAVLAFYEGNDLSDLARENLLVHSAEARRARGQPAPGSGWWQEQLEPQSSFVRAIAGLFAPRPPPPSVRQATFRSEDGEIPVSLYALPGSLGDDGLATLFDQALSDWARTARELGAKPWLLYLPCKRRVLDGLVHFEPDAPVAVRSWRPSPLPAQVRRSALDRGITFVDATDALVTLARQGQLPFNSVWDSHLNALGARQVAGVLAEALVADGAGARSGP